MATLLVARNDADPDCSGTYVYAGEHDGEPYYVYNDMYWIAYYAGVEQWYIQDADTEAIPLVYWIGNTATGTYVPGPDASGNPTVSAVGGATSLMGKLGFI